MDLDPDRVEALNRAESPLFEPGLDALLATNRGRYHATTDYEELLNCDISFITVGTPSHDDGSIDLEYVRSARGGTRKNRPAEGKLPPRGR